MFAGFEFDVEDPAAFLFIEKGQAVCASGKRVSFEGVAFEVFPVEEDPQPCAWFDGEVSGLGDGLEFDVEGDGFLGTVTNADHTLIGLKAIFSDLDAVALFAFFEGDALGGESLSFFVQKDRCVIGFGREIDHDFGWCGGRLGEIGIGVGDRVWVGGGNKDE